MFNIISIRQNAIVKARYLKDLFLFYRTKTHHLKLFFDIFDIRQNMVFDLQLGLCIKILIIPYSLIK